LSPAKAGVIANAAAAIKANVNFVIVPN
jgi:hypothetical protein